MTLNAVAFFALTYHVLWDDYREWFGLIALGLSLFYALLAFVAIRRPSTPAEMALFAPAHRGCFPDHRRTGSN